MTLNKYIADDDIIHGRLKKNLLQLSSHEIASVL